MLPRDHLKFTLSVGVKKMFENKVNGHQYVQQQAEVAAAAMTKSKKSKHDVWHQQLGRLNQRDLKKLIPEKNVAGKRVSRDSKQPTCEICLNGKLTRTSFARKSVPSAKPLNIVHTYIC